MCNDYPHKTLGHSCESKKQRIVGDMKTASRLLHDLLLHGYTQAEISRAIDVHHSQISRWVRGDPPRYADAILKLREVHAINIAPPKSLRRA